MTQKDIYLTSLQKKFTNGLQRVGFFISGIQSETEEALYAELNRMENATDVPDVEVLGKYSPQ